MKSQNCKLCSLISRIDLCPLLLCYIGVVLLIILLLDSVFPVFKYSLLYANIIISTLLLIFTIGLIIVIKYWRISISKSLPNKIKILFSSGCFFLSFLILFFIEYLIYINNQDEFNIENNYLKDSTKDKINNIKKEIAYLEENLNSYRCILEELKYKEYIEYNNTGNYYFTVINGDTIELKIYEQMPLPGEGSNGFYPEPNLNNAESIGILLNNESEDIPYPTSRVILESMQQNDCIRGNDFRSLVYQKIEKYKNLIKEFNTILENEIFISFEDFIIYNIFNSNITGNKTHVLIRVIFFFQAVVITFFSGYIYQTLYKIIDGEKNIIKNSNLIEKALLIATKAHNGQVDKSGSAYISHPIRVSNRCNTEEERIVALLHDTIEDTWVTPEYLLSEGFPATIVEAVLSVTRNENESYEDFILRSKQNHIGKQVKIHDLEDNMDITRLPSLTEKDFKRLNKYLFAYRALKE